jgi:tetratricopeptide (TPR) repeat protein
MKKRWLIIFLTVVFPAVLVYAFYQKGYLDRWTDDGMALHRLRAGIFPNDPRALDRLTRALRDRPEYQDAIRSFRRLAELKAAGIDPDPEAARKAVEKVEALRHNYERAIELDPYYREARLNLAELYEATFQVQSALAVYYELVRRDPDFPEGHFRLGRWFMLTGDDARALESFEKYLSLRPRAEDAYLAVIDIYNTVLAKNPDKESWSRVRRDALDRFVRLINRKKPNADSYYNLGVLYAGTGDWSRAISAWQTALDHDPGHAPSLNQLGDVLLRSGQAAEAVKHFEKAVKSRPREVRGYLNLGRAYLSLGQPERAGQYYQQALKISPSDETAHFSLGYISELQGQLRQALVHYDAAVRANPRHAEAVYNYGNVQAALLNFDEAKEAYREVLRINPNHLNASVNGCLLAFQREEYKSAAEICENARLLGYSLPAGMDEVLRRYKGKAGEEHK